jgi:hypothetical protein
VFVWVQQAVAAGIQVGLCVIRALASLTAQLELLLASSAAATANTGHTW